MGKKRGPVPVEFFYKAGKLWYRVGGAELTAREVEQRGLLGPWRPASSLPPGVDVGAIWIPPALDPPPGRIPP